LNFTLETHFYIVTDCLPNLVNERSVSNTNKSLTIWGSKSCSEWWCLY